MVLCALRNFIYRLTMFLNEEPYRVPYLPVTSALELLSASFQISLYRDDRCLTQYYP